MILGYLAGLGYGDEDDLDDLELPRCTECPAPIQVGVDHSCKQCAAHCLLAAYRRARAAP